MKCIKNFSIFCCLFYFNFLNNIFCTELSSRSDDPFKSLGIPDLNSEQLLEEVDISKKKVKLEGPVKLSSIDDLPNFLKNTNLNEEDALKVLTRFLIQDDLTLKKFGVVYDQTGFDGIQTSQKISPVGTEERSLQRARSSANLWVCINF